MKNHLLSPEVIAAIITVGGSVSTFLLASLFSMLSRKMDFKHFVAKEALNRRLSFYEELVRWLPVEKLSESVQPKQPVSCTLKDIFMQHFGEFADFILRARLYASDDVVRELIAFQEAYNVVLSKAIADKNLNKHGVSGKSGGDIEIDALIALCRKCTDRIIDIVSSEVAADIPRKDFGKVSQKRNQKR